MRKILVCLDGSSLSEQILPYVKHEAERYGSKIVLLQVVSITRILVASPPVSHTGAALIDRFINEQLSQAKTYLESLAQPLRNEGLEVECVVLSGTVADAIVRYAKKNGVDCIALATHGWKWLSRLIFGSVAETVIKETRLPVLLLKPGPAGSMLWERLRFRERTWSTRMKSAALGEKVLSEV